MKKNTYKLQNTIMDDIESLKKRVEKYTKHVSITGEYNYMRDNDIRYVMQDVGMYGIVTNDWLYELANFLEGKKVLEVMCGRGWLSKGLKDMGINVIATDAQKSYLYWKERGLKELTNIEKISAKKAVEKYHNDVDYIIISWPPYDTPSAYNVIQKLKELESDVQVIFIGEGHGGCTANEDFFESIYYIEEPGFDKVEYAYDKVVHGIEIPHIHDNISIVEPK